MLGAGCYVEPEPVPWMGDQTRNMGCSIDGIEVTADAPIMCAALAANIERARAVAQLPAGALVGMRIVVHNGVRCLSTPEPDGNACTYAFTSTDGGDASAWTGATIELNEHGTQLAHEFTHVRYDWENVPNAQHQNWTGQDWEVTRADAERSFEFE